MVSFLFCEITKNFPNLQISTPQTYKNNMGIRMEKCEKSRQNPVSLFVRSRKEMCKESLLPRLSSFTFSQPNRHLWLLRVLDVASDSLICGI
jgi:hypothetical protein